MDVRLTSSSEVVTGLAHHGLALDGSAAFSAAPVNDIASLTMDPVRVAGVVKQLRATSLRCLPFDMVAKVSFVNMQRTIVQQD